MFARKSLSKKNNLSSLLLLWQYCSGYTSYVYGAIIALLFSSLAVLALGKGVAFMIDHAFSSNLSTAEQSQNKDIAFIYLGVIVLILAIATYSRYRLISCLGEYVIADIRKDAFKFILIQDIGYFSKNRVGDLLARLTSDIAILQLVVGGSFSVALRNIVLFIGGMIFLVISSPKLTIYLLFILPTVLIPILTIGKKVRKLSRITQEKISELNINAEELIYGIRAIRSFGIEQLEKSRYDEKSQQVIDIAKKRIFWRSLLTAIVIVQIFGAVLFILWLGSQMVITNMLSAGELSSFVFYAIVVAGAVGSLSETAGELFRAAGAAERIVQILPQQQSLQKGKDIVFTYGQPGNEQDFQFSNINKDSQNILQLQNVSFYYDNGECDDGSITSLILDNISLDINKGDNIAIVGLSGAGKSTLVNILLRFYTPQQGRILLYDTDIAEIPNHILRKTIIPVPQEPIIFSGTVYDNIVLGEKLFSHDQVNDAIDNASADFIYDLEKGVDTEIGERGVKLSGGQRQRIAIARALIRNPEILLLDEATSHLDAHNENIIQETLARVSSDKTVITISHRMATIAQSSKIVLLNDGKIEAIGNHDEMMNDSELYRHLVKLQAEKGNDVII